MAENIASITTEEEQLKNQAVSKSAENDPNDLSRLTLEQLILLINAKRLNTLQEQTKKELLELKNRQSQVKELHDLMEKINHATNEKGEFTPADELKNLLQKAKELGVETDPSKASYSKEERERLMENIRMRKEELNTENEMQLQTVSRLTNERYETYQMARSNMRPLHEAKKNMARAIAGK